MKRTILLVSLFLAAGLLMAALQGCKGPEGPAGPAGESKILQLEGFAADINCGDCHNPDTDTTYYVWARKWQWEAAGHVTGGTFADRNSAPCSGCHTTEGFIQRAKAGFPAQATGTAWGSIVTRQGDPSPVGCFACHSPHSNGDFALRTSLPVQLWSPMEGITDRTINLGKGNLCMNCHQPRGTSFSPRMKTTLAAAETLRVTSSRWYPHYGVQGLMFLGVGNGGGFEFPGKTYVNSAHSSQAGIVQNGCPTCHMAEPTDLGNGGHSNIIGDGGSPESFNVNGCLQSGCHTSMNVSTYVGASSSLTGGLGVHTYVEQYLDTLSTLLQAKGILGSNGLVQGNNGTSNASSSNPRTFVGPAGLLQAGALYNFFFIEHDVSDGIHNSRYAVQLLNDSIEEMRKP